MARRLRGAGTAALAALLLGACGSDPAKVEAVRDDAPSETAHAPIVDRSVEDEGSRASEESRGVALARPPASKLAPLAAKRYRAIGTEPFWAVTVKGSTAILERPDKPSRAFAVSRNDDERATRYLGEGFSMTVSEGPCSDGMSDAVWSDQVSIAFGEGTLKGCGGDRQDPVEGEL